METGSLAIARKLYVDLEVSAELPSELASAVRAWLGGERITEQ
jgi:hypothetical protein